MLRKRMRAAFTSLTLIIVVALGIHAVFAWSYINARPRQALSVIPFMYESADIAVSLAQGHGFSSPFRIPTGPTAWMTPVYPLLLAGVFRIFGIYSFDAYLAATALNILFVSLACIPIFFVGRRISGAGLGAGAVWLWAVFPNAILLTYQSMWDACLSALLAAIILWATLALAESARPRDWIGYGVLWGVALMTNATLLSVLPFLLLWLAWRARRRRRAWIVLPLISLCTALLCCVPWTVRNYSAFHRFVPLRSVLGLQLWLGNNADAKPPWLGTQHPINDAAEREKYIAMGEMDYMDAKKREALHYMAAHPQHELKLMAERFVSTWSGGTSEPLRDLARSESAWFDYVLLFNLLAAILALAGIAILFARRSLYAVPLTTFVIVFPCAYYLTLALPRYRLPIDPIVMLLAAIAFTAIRPRQRLAASVVKHETPQDIGV